MEAFSLYEVAGVAISGFATGASVGYFFGYSKNITQMPMRCNTLIEHATSLADARPIKVKPVNVEANRGKTLRCDCMYLKKKQCQIDAKRCHFF